MDLSTDEVDSLCWCFDGEALGCVAVYIFKESIKQVYQRLRIRKLGLDVGYQVDSVVLNGTSKQLCYAITVLRSC